MKKYKAIKPKGSNGWAEVLNPDKKDICACYPSTETDPLKIAQMIARALNAMEKAKQEKR